jgi:hypothetical protein
MHQDHRVPGRASAMAGREETYPHSVYGWLRRAALGGTRFGRAAPTASPAASRASAARTPSKEGGGSRAG